MKKELLSYKDTFKRAWEIFKNNRVNFFYIGIISFIISSIPKILTNIPEGPLDIYFLPIIILIAIVLGIIINFIYPLALVDSIDSNIKGIASDFNSSYSNSLKKFWGYVWVCLLSSLVIFGFSSLLIIPGIIFSFLLPFTIFTFYLNDKRGMKSLVSSWQYVEGNWWNVFARIIVFALLMIVASIISAIIFNIILSPLTIILGLNVDLIISELMSFVQYSIFAPVLFSCLYVIFKDLESIKSLTPEEENSPKTESKKKWLYFGSIFGILSFLAMIVLTISVFAFLSLSREKSDAKSNFNKSNDINKHVILDR